MSNYFNYQLNIRFKMIDTEMKILAGILVFLLLLAQLKYAMGFLIFIIFIYLFGFFFTSIGLDVDLVKLDNSEIYFQEYTGDYDKLYAKLREYNAIKKKFKLSSKIYNPFGIFYDDPDIQDRHKCRAVIGVIRNLKGEGDADTNTDAGAGLRALTSFSEIPIELKEYFKQNKFTFNILPETQCIYGSYHSIFSIQSSFFLFLSKLIIELTNAKFFRRLFIPKWKENKIKIARNNYKKHFGVLEIIKNGKLEFYIPTEKEKEFFLHSVEVSPARVKKAKSN